MKILSVLIFTLWASLFTFSAHAEMHDLRNSSISEVYINDGGSGEGVMLIKVPGVSGYLSIGKVGDKTSEILYSTALAAKLSNQTNLWIRYWDSAEGYPSVGIIAIR